MNEPRENGPEREEAEQDKPDVNEQFAGQAKQLFDDSVERLDAAALSRLNQGRHRALAELQQTTPVGQWARWMPATGVAAAALVTVILLQGPGVDGPEPPAASVTDFEILLGEDSLEMLEELEFYSWIDIQNAEADDNVG